MAAKKNKLEFFQTALSVVLVITKFLGLIELSALITKELRMAGKSMVWMIMLAVMLAILITTAWICLLAMLLIYLVVSLQTNLIVSVFIVFMLNIFLIMMVGLFLHRLKKNLFFTETRQSCRSICKE